MLAGTHTNTPKHPKKHSIFEEMVHNANKISITFKQLRGKFVYIFWSRHTVAQGEIYTAALHICHQAVVTVAHML